MFGGTLQPYHPITCQTGVKLKISRLQNSSLPDVFFTTLSVAFMLIKISNPISHGSNRKDLSDNNTSKVITWMTGRPPISRSR